ncbi:hypothetical protein PoB_000314000 [Plakobranchus ocellatus]|uniref:Uncharacterized protein n=1 Tax=Plakobranchus ocellatus TaxID=259542 RepID=A0AAV3Y153_9GAST|nr:hypothetical protein PoB_000314000 [Plakobranchus ocellatus]
MLTNSHCVFITNVPGVGWSSRLSTLRSLSIYGHASLKIVNIPGALALTLTVPAIFIPSLGFYSKAQYHNLRASMDSGVVTSSGSQATYQNLPPAKRRPPPPPPPGGQDSSPDGPPPALPPRRYREPAETTPVMTNNISSNKLGESQGFEPSPESPASSSNPSQPTSSPRESSSTATADKHNRIHVIPLSRQQHQQDGGGDQSEIPKRDFKSLRSQWENNSPREDRYAAELRKQAHKFSHSQQPQQQQQQQQQPNPMPMAFKHSRTPINFSTTYKREPALPQEATSPASCSSPSLSESTTISSTSSSTHAQLQQQHPGLPSVSAAPNAGQHFSSIASSTPSSLSPPSSSSSSSATLRASTTTNPTEPSSSGDDHSKQTVSSPPPPQLPERTFGVKHQQQQHQQYHHQQHDAGRFRSSSDASPTPSSASSGGGSAQPASGRYNSASAATISPNSRNHGAPDQETLSDQRHSQKIASNNQSFSPSTAPHPHHSSVEGTQWRPLRTPEVPPPPQQLQGQQLSDDSMSAEFPPPPPEAMQDNPEE